MEMAQNYRAWEKAAIVGSLFVSVISFLGYVKNFPLLDYVTHIQRNASGDHIGVVSQSESVLRRQLLEDIEFRMVAVGSDLFDHDTITTDATGAATVTLDDGSTIELAPNTMIRLIVDKGFAFPAITPSATVTVIAGHVTGRAKSRKITLVTNSKEVRLSPGKAQVVESIVARPILATRVQPTAPPVAPPLSLQLISPGNDAAVSVDKGSAVAEKKIRFTWRLSPPQKQVTLVLKRNSAELLKTRVELDGSGSGSYEWTAQKPGSYEWQVLDAEGKNFDGLSQNTARFVLAPEFEAIEVFDVLVAGKARRSNLLDGSLSSEFNLKFSWKPYSGAEKYKVTIAATPDLKTKALELLSSRSAVTTNQNRVFTGRFFYQISALLPNGFKVLSAVKSYEFDFMPPTLSVPSNNAVISLAAAQKTKGLMYLSWEKTNFTDGYDIEVAGDVAFRKIHTSKTAVKQNFVAINFREAGRYWWRVRSVSSALPNKVSRWSQPSSFTCVP